eukprot:Em0008g1125a
MISQAPAGSISVVERASSFVDRHLMFFRTLPIVIGGIGLVLVLRHLNHRMFLRFKRVSDIPMKYLESNKRLFGVVPSTEWDSINVWHVPTGKRLLRIGNRPPIGCPKDELLRIKFSGVSVGQSAELENWLNSRLLEREVWFTLLHPQGKRTVECAVYAKQKGAFGKKYCVNAELVAEGLGTTTEAQGFSSSEAKDKFMGLLSKREQSAKTGGKGMWDGSEYESWWTKTKKFFRRSQAA